MKNEHTAMVYIHWNEHTDRYTQYLVPYDIAKAIDKLLEKNQIEKDYGEIIYRVRGDKND